jgi:type 1 glutamine amidotransferase
MGIARIQRYVECMAEAKRIVFHVGGPAFHPVDLQANQIVQWLGPEYRCSIHEGARAFDHLDQADLLVLMGLYWTGSHIEYVPLNGRHKEALERYVASGRPILSHHGAIASYDDWPRFGELTGFAWIWGKTNHSPVGTYTVQVPKSSHPITRELTDYTLVDELYYDIQVTRGLEPTVHATATWNGLSMPMIMSASGGRTAGAGKTAYLANGHDMRAFEGAALKTVWLNTVRWLLER